VCGLPEPNARHPVVMAKFASSCRQKFNTLVSDMVTQLGPDTRDLTLRIGLHSGPVTAGVLRGQKSRFQLFGDTVNTASRMESNGQQNKIHASQETAKQLIESGKAHWVVPRDTLVQAKGKGTIQTYWVEPATSGSHTEGTSVSNNDEEDPDETALVLWTADILSSVTRRVAVYHDSVQAIEPKMEIIPKMIVSTVIDEFKEAIDIPQVHTLPFNHLTTPMELNELVKKEIHAFVLAISLTYRGKSLKESSRHCRGLRHRLTD
jgi:Adenylate and Guanylate cyclase catalytic domain